MICDLQHTDALFVSYSNSLEIFQGTVVNLDQDIMSDGGALSFSQAKALILKQRLSADEVKSLQTANCSANNLRWVWEGGASLFSLSWDFPCFRARGRPQPIVPLSEVGKQGGVWCRPEAKWCQLVKWQRYNWLFKGPLLSIGRWRKRSRTWRRPC